MTRLWPLLVLSLILAACAGPSVQDVARRQSFNYSYPFRAISSEEFVPQIDLASDAPPEIVADDVAPSSASRTSFGENAAPEEAMSAIDDASSAKAGVTLPDATSLSASPVIAATAAADTTSSATTSSSKEVSSSSSSTTTTTSTTSSSDDSLGQLVDQMAQQDTPAARYLADDLFIKATDASLHGNTEVSIKLYRYLCRLRPQEVELQRKLAMELVRGGEVSEALKIVQVLHQQAPFADESITLALAGLYTVSGANEAAFNLYQAAMEHFPRSESTCSMAIEAYEQAQKLDAAAQVAAACQKRMPKAIFAYYRGRLALAQEKTAEGIKFLEQALKIDPQYRPAALVLGLLAEQEGNYARAKQIYRTFLQHDESNLVILGRLVQIHFNEQDYAAALPLAERMANLDSEDLSLKLKLAILYLDLQRVDDARSILQEILAAVPDSDKAWYYLGAAEVMAGQQDAAFTAWAKINEESSLFAQARLQQAQILWAKLKQQPSPENETAFLDFLTLNENHPKVEADFKLMRAAYAQEQGDLDLALKILRKLEREQKLDMDGQYYLMVLLQESKSLPEAMEVGRKLLAQHPDHAHALNFMGYALLEDASKFAEAYSYLMRAIKLAPDDHYIRDSLAWYYYRTNDYGHAAQEIKLALAAAPDDAAINHHAALISLSLNKQEQACTFFKKAWQAGDENLRSEIAGQVEVCPNFSFSGEEESPRATTPLADGPSAPEEEISRETEIAVSSEATPVPLTTATANGDEPKAAKTLDAAVTPPKDSAPAAPGQTPPPVSPPSAGPMADDDLLDDDPILLDPKDN